MKDKLTAQDLVNFFQEKPFFDKSETDSSILYGWPSTHGGLYSITDIYKHFEAKGFTHKNIDDIKEKCFQTQDSFTSVQKMEKGKTHIIRTIRVKNFNPQYKKEPNFTYYFYDISKEEVILLKEDYEAQSKALMLPNINKQKTAKSISISSANRKAKRIPKSKKLVTE